MSLPRIGIVTFLQNDPFLTGFVEKRKKEKLLLTTYIALDINVSIIVAHYNRVGYV